MERRVGSLFLVGLRESKRGCIPYRSLYRCNLCIETLNPLKIAELKTTYTLRFIRCRDLFPPEF